MKLYMNKLCALERDSMCYVWNVAFRIRLRKNAGCRLCSDRLLADGSSRISLLFDIQILKEVL